MLQFQNQFYIFTLLHIIGKLKLKLIYKDLLSTLNSIKSIV